LQRSRGLAALALVRVEVVIAFIPGRHNNASAYDEGHDKSLAGFMKLLQNRATSDAKHSHMGIERRKFNGLLAGAIQNSSS